MDFNDIKGKLKGMWDWVKGNAKCDKCGSYDTLKIESDFIKTEQRWETDYSCPRGPNGLRPQNVFNISYFNSCWKCKKCSINTWVVEVQKSRA